ncbi:MAG: protein-L-isoaspartate(D-aspartate) O-methyltransferase [Candidatus Cloacimonetes bacterium]|nr:protein-L-isoaspartate(D-aspartate) O-methyltransferase [Candidatus Cloacimonadota bacterium]MBS3767825.1 protein-L-isoaspartate(D-aspartate) O-methyltransferase [Candidatus Cloacimonadota bacterium]
MNKLINPIIMALLLIIFPACKEDKTPNDFTTARKQMVQRQLEGRDITDKAVLEAMQKVERHKFVPPNLRNMAYADRPLPIGEGQTISQPYIVALMTQLADIQPHEKVLEIGTGSGYQAAILASLCHQVYTIEIIESLCEQARIRLTNLGYKNVYVKCGDGFKGWKEHAPYDAIIVTCAPPEVPQPLINQLAEKGKIVIPVGTQWQELKVITKENDKIKTSDIIPVRFVPMTGEEVEKM